MSSLSSRQCLEHVAAVETDYLLIEGVWEWTAVELLASLARIRPDRLDLPMYLRLPDTNQDGAICQVTQSGYIRRYRICFRAAR